MGVWGKGEETFEKDSSPFNQVYLPGMLCYHRMAEATRD